MTNSTKNTKYNNNIQIIFSQAYQNNQEKKTELTKTKGL